MDNEKMTVIVIEPGMKPYVQDIQSGLESLQREVGGDIQAISPYTDAVSIICAESGKLMGMPFNRALRDEDGHIYDALVGKFLIVGLGEENFTSIPEKLIPKYSQVFETPEQLVRIGEKNYILPAKDDTPVYLEESEKTPEEYSLILQCLEKRGLISIDYDKPLKSFNDSAYASYPVRGSFALTQRGQQVVELLDVQGID